MTGSRVSRYWVGDNMKAPSFTLPKACGLLLISVVAAWVLGSSFVIQRSGTDGVMAVSLAAAICFTSSVTALIVTGLTRNPSHSLHGPLFAILLRMAPPFAFIAVLRVVGGVLVEAGVCGWIVVFYLLTLSIETALSLCLK